MYISNHLGKPYIHVYGQLDRVYMCWLGRGGDDDDDDGDVMNDQV